MRQTIFLLLMFPLLLQAQSKKSFLITGKLKSIPEKSEVDLLDFNGTDTIAKTHVENGNFYFKR